MQLDQVSIFVENKAGRLAEITEVLSQNQIDIRAMSIADTRDFGILRLIVNAPKTAEEALKKAGFTVSITKVVGVAIEDRAGGLVDVLKVLSGNGISVEYMYAFIARIDHTAFVILRVEDNARTLEILEQNSIQTLRPEQVYEI